MCTYWVIFFYIVKKKNVCSGLHKSIYIFKKYHTLGTFLTSHKETQLILLTYKYMTLAVLSCYSKKKVMVFKPVLWGKTSPLSEIMQSVVQVISTCGVYGLRSLTPFHHYSSYIMAVSFIGGGIRITRRKQQTCHKSLTNFST